MIRWYDYLAAFLAADFMTGFIFSGGIFGGVAAYAVYYVWGELYCPYRLTLEQ